KNRVVIHGLTAIAEKPPKTGGARILASRREPEHWEHDEVFHQCGNSLLCAGKTQRRRGFWVGNHVHELCRSGTRKPKIWTRVPRPSSESFLRENTTGP